MEIFFLQVEFHEQFIEASVHVPIDESGIVTWNIITEIRELNTLALTAASPLTFHSSAEYLATD